MKSGLREYAIPLESCSTGMDSLQEDRYSITVEFYSLNFSNFCKTAAEDGQSILHSMPSDCSAVHYSLMVLN